MKSQCDNNSPIIRVTKEKRCPICEYSDWCGYSADGQLAFCMRVSAGSVKTARNGAAVHVLKGPILVSNDLLKQHSEQLIADINQRHLIYTEMLRILCLSSKHSDHLINIVDP